MITITASSGLSKEEVERMKKDAEMHAEDDKKKREAADLKVNAETVLSTGERLIRESGDKMSAEDKKTLEDKMSALKAVKDGSDQAAIKQALDDVNTIAQKIGTAMYQSAGAQSQTNQTAGETSGQSGPVEGEVVDDKKE